MATSFLVDVKKALGAEKWTELCQTIQNYKKTDNYEQMVTRAVSLFTEKEENFGFLVRFSMFIRPHHKKEYKELVEALRGQST